MPSNYPTGLDAFTTGTLTGVVSGSDHGNKADALNKIEAELGVDPSGSAATVKARLDSVESVHVNVREHGALPSASAATNDTAFNAAMAALPATGGVLVIPPGTYNKTAQINLPTTLSGSQPTFVISGPRAVIAITGAISAFGNTLPANQTAADALAARRIVFDGLHITGDNTAGQKGIALACASHSEFRGVMCFSLDVGLELTFALHTRLVECMAVECVTYGFKAQSGTGLWTGATHANSPSNQTKFVDCRNYAKAGMTSGFHILHSDVEIDSPTCEGFNPVNNIYYEANDGSIKVFYISGNCHFENVPTTAHIRLNTNGVRTVIAQPYAQGGAVIVDATGSTQASLVKLGFPYVPSTPAFKGDATGCGWIFEESGTYGDFDPFNSANWSGGVVPRYIAASTFKNIGGDILSRLYGGALQIKNAAGTGNSTIGTATLVGGTVVVNTAAVSATSVVLLTCQTPGGTPGFLRVSARTAGTSFTILSSSGTDTSAVGWLIVEPV